MSWRWSLLLAGLGLAVALGIAQFQDFPGYLDSDYYYAGGVQLAEGKGFSEPYVWNYLDQPSGLPHPSHSYWMPLASLIAAVGMRLTGRVNYDSARLGFLALAAAVPVVTAALAYSFRGRRDLALISGLLAVFSVYYLPFLPVADNYGAYLVLGALFLLMMGRRSHALHFPTGLLAGFMSLARSDGLLWLLLGAVVAGLNLSASKAATPPFPQEGSGRPPAGRWLFLEAAGRIGLVLLGFSIVMGPWYARNYAIYGTPLAPGGGRLLWLTSYDDTFAYPAEQLTYTRWIAQGLPAILSARWAALRWNLLNAFAAQGEIFLAPFILVGAWTCRKDPRVRVAVVAWAILLFVMTIVFPFAGSRGGFFHAGASVQSLWWTLAPLGLDSVVDLARRRGRFTADAYAVFRGGLVGITILMSAVIVSIRVFPRWGEGEQQYPRIEQFLQRSGAQTGEIVMTRNPPGYYIMTGRPAIVVPFAGADAILAAADQFHARYLVIEAVGAAGPIKDVYAAPSEEFELLGELDGTRIFRFRP